MGIKQLAVRYVRLMVDTPLDMHRQLRGTDSLRTWDYNIV